MVVNKKKPRRREVENLCSLSSYLAPILSDGNEEGCDDCEYIHFWTDFKSLVFTCQETVFNCLSFYEGDSSFLRLLLRQFLLWRSQDNGLQPFFLRTTKQIDSFLFLLGDCHAFP